MRRPAGVSLAETIIAMFVLTAAMVVSAALYDTALGYSVKIEQRQRAAQAAGQRLEEIRAWSRNAHGTSGTVPFKDGWTAYNGSSVTYPDYPGYTVTATVENFQLFSPGSEFESAFFAVLEDESIDDGIVNKRFLKDSAMRVTVTASWNTGPQDRVVVTSMMTDPVKDYGFSGVNLGDAIAITYSTGGAFSTTPPGALAIGDSVKVRAKIQDAHGQVVDNAIVQWYIDPKSSGNGTLTAQPDLPTDADFRNQVVVDKDPDATGDEITVNTGGSVRLVARARLGGVDAFQITPPIELSN